MNNPEAGAGADTPVDVYRRGMQESTIMESIIVTGRGIREPLIIEPTDEPGVYTTPNGILTRRYVDISEVYRSADIVATPVDQC